MTEALANTTMGACVVCNRQAPTGWSRLRAGAIVLMVGLVTSLLAYFFKAEALSSVFCAVGVGIGAPLLLWGLLRGVSSGTTGTFAVGSVELEPGTVQAGKAFTAHVEVVPDHPLNVRTAGGELVAVEEIDGLAGPESNVVKKKDVTVTLPPRVTDTVEQALPIDLPADWPATMESPGNVNPRRRIRTRLVVSVDFDAHPLLTFEAQLTVTAARR